MAAFSTLALIAGGLIAGELGAKKLTSKPKDATVSPPSTLLGRSRPADSPVLGQAVPRADPTAATTTTPKPPVDPATTGSAITAANAAAQKARRRGASGSLLSGTGSPQPSPKFAPKTLLGY